MLVADLRNHFSSLWEHLTLFAALGGESLNWFFQFPDSVRACGEGRHVMSGPECILAMVLLVAPPGSPVPDVTVEEFPALQAALHFYGVEWEILDPREAKYVLTRFEDFQSDLDLLRKRHQDLKDVPKISDSKRFPDRSTVNEMLSFNRQFRKHLETSQLIESHRANHYGLAMRETDRLYQIWDSVRDARCDFYYVTVRRQALKKLKCLIGTEAYFGGELPPYVPTWRFQEMN